MEDFLAYFILVTVIVWFCHNTYKKFKRDNGSCGCSGGCGGCNTQSDLCDDSKKISAKDL